MSLSIFVDEDKFASFLVGSKLNCTTPALWTICLSYSLSTSPDVPALHQRLLPYVQGLVCS